MCSVQQLRDFIRERLTAAAEEIFTQVEKTIISYEEEIKLLGTCRNKPQIKTTDPDRDEPEPLQIKQEEPELPLEDLGTTKRNQKEPVPGGQTADRQTAGRQAADRQTAGRQAADRQTAGRQTAGRALH